MKKSLLLLLYIYEIQLLYLINKIKHNNKYVKKNKIRNQNNNKKY